MHNGKRLIVLVGIVLVAVLLRFWQLGGVPASPDWDEASIGYNAYSILHTGRDEYGTFLPFTIRSFDDYKPPLYVYLTVPSVYLFGLSVWSVRLASAVLGVLAVIGTYYFVRELFKRESIALLSTLLLAISPWHIQFSRAAFEANIGVTFVIWGVYFFIRKKLVPSALIFSLSLYAYHSERIFVPLYVIFLLILYRGFVKKQSVFSACIVGLVVALPLVSVFTDANVLKRLQSTSAFRKQTELLSGTIPKLEYDRSLGWWPGEFFDNRRIEYAKILASGYLSHFSPKWLFLSGDHERHHAPRMGLLYLWELPFILIGIYHLVRQKSRAGMLLLGWWVLAPIAAAPTTEVPHAIRTLVSLPTYQIFTAVGIVSMLPKWKATVKIALPVIAVISFVYYVHMYYGHTNYEYAKHWQYGYEQAVTYAQKHTYDYEKIVVSTKLEQPYIFFLFYTKFDPKTYISTGKLDKYEFRQINWNSEIPEGRVLYIGVPEEIPGDPLVEIDYPSGETAIRISTK